MSSQPLLLLLLLALVAVVCSGVGVVAHDGSFNETLLVRPVHDGRLLMHWEFELRETGMDGQHFTVFPKALGQLLWTMKVHSMALSLSSGRWLTDDLGYLAHAPRHWQSARSANVTSEDELTRVPRPQHAPFGAELWAVLDNEGTPMGGDVPAADEGVDVVQARVDARWGELQAALSGIFCASLNQMSSLTTSNPERLLRPNFNSSSSASDGRPGSFRYATLPRESVCTENLAPFLKMLPCRRERGLGSMLNPLKLFRAHYSSIQLRVSPIFEGTRLTGWHLTQSVSVLLDPQRMYGSREWSLSKLIGTEAEPGQGAACACPLSHRSALHVHLPPTFAARFPASVAALIAGQGGDDVPASEARFDLGPVPARVVRQAAGHTLLSFDLKQLSSSSSSSGVDASATSALITTSACPRGAIDLAAHYRPAAGKEAASVFEVRDLTELLPASLLSNHSAAPVTAAGSAPSLLSPLELPIRVHRYLSASSLTSGDLFLHLHNPSPTHAFRVEVFDAIPWFVEIQHHSLAIANERGESLHASDLLERSYTPAALRSTPAQLYFHLRLRPNSTVSLSLHFAKAMLTTEEYPPDVSRGFDIGSAIITVTMEEAGDSHERSAHQSAPPRLLHYTSGLLLLLPFPDFSMPFNVIAFTSTVLAFFFGSVFNITYSNYADVLKRKPRIKVDKDGKPVLTKPMDKIKALFGKKKTPAASAKSSDAPSSPKSPKPASEPRERRCGCGRRSKPSRSARSSELESKEE